MKSEQIEANQYRLHRVRIGAAVFLIVSFLLAALTATFIYFVVGWTHGSPAAWNLKALLILLACILITAFAAAWKATPFVVAERQKPRTPNYSPLLKATIYEFAIVIALAAHSGITLIVSPSPPMRITPSIWHALGIALVCIFVALYALFELARPQGEQFLAIPLSSDYPDKVKR